mgnify:CR=1 FL=1
MPPKQYADVDTFLSEIEPTQRPILEAIRQSILEVSPHIAEGIKWNCLSFRTHEWFGTLNVRPHRGKPAVLLILHAGAKVRPAEAAAIAVPDPAGLLEWLGRDRASVRFVDMDDWTGKRSALIEVIRVWVSA